MVNINTRGKATRPEIRGVPGVRAPRGFGVVEMNFTSKGLKGVGLEVVDRPAGDPPADWPGTLPEWSIYWALRQKGFEEDVDFVYLARTAGVGIGYWSELDFFIIDIALGLEIQGEYWHYSLGYEKMRNDALREALFFSTQGVTVVQLPEAECLRDPEGTLDDALRKV